MEFTLKQIKKGEAQILALNGYIYLHQQFIGTNHELVPEIRTSG